MQLEDLRLFTNTIDSGSFTAAAERLGLSKQYVSRRMTMLEDELGVRLLDRTTRQTNPTDIGMTLYARAIRILDDVDETKELVSSQSYTARGTLRISAPMTFGTMYLGEILPTFLEQHPLVHLELDLNDRPVDIVGEGYDMAIRSGQLADSTLVARRLMDVDMVACASPDYLNEHPAPAAPHQLKEYDCLLYGHGSSMDWVFDENDSPLQITVKGPLRANNGEVLRDLAIAGRGIAYLPDFIVSGAVSSGQLMPILRQYSPSASAVYAVYPKHRQSSRLVQLFVEFLIDHFAARARSTTIDV
ncbi:LysR family transcriptional regulator [Marinobacter nanhaiticus D15-8W]|uniref:LysR family transcriptional regulator n=1 Tax=Marinobacter nanhaiticus D15-8W TaxID=626887 RepID=N6WYK3_9GAMM|nr:LysR family transcriptional regulator [Marinobacter nanhaiticus]ENO13873.1 LysR family transcriptional regulator [Marinobacter nanhaiticus D15-8W]